MKFRAFQHRRGTRLREPQQNPTRSVGTRNHSITISVDTRPWVVWSTIRDLLRIDGRRVAGENVWVLVGVTVATLIVDAISARLLGTTTLSFALAIPAGVLFGPFGAVGFATGRLYHALIAGGTGPALVFLTVGDLCFVVVGYMFVGRRTVPIDDVRSFLRYLRTYAGAVLVASLCSAAFVASGLTLIERMHFVVAAQTFVTDRFFSGLVLGFVVLLLLSAGTTRHEVAWSGQLSSLTGLGVAFVAVSWLGLGSVLSLAHRDFTAFPAVKRAIADILPSVIEPVTFATLGPLYGPIQAAIMLTGSVFTLATLAGERTDSGPASDRSDR